jgi:hypothetical protein
MSTMEIYDLTTTDLEDIANQIKGLVLAKLALDGVLSPEDADTWAKDHAIIIRRKRMFQSIKDSQKVEETKEPVYWIIVSK